MLDRQRLAAVREARRQQAERYFDGQAAGWDSEQDLGIDGALVEAELQRLFETDRPANLLDVGTGTGLTASWPGMSAAGSASTSAATCWPLPAAGSTSARRATAQVRHGDMYQLPLPDRGFAAVLLHQVLHFADDPLRVLTEAARARA